MQIPHNFTDNEKNKYTEEEYLKKRRRELLKELEDVEARLLETRSVYNTRNPILTLPVEVICLIFTFARLPSSRDAAQWEAKTSGEGEEGGKEDGEDVEEEEAGEEEEKNGFPEVVVSHVCRRWRSISLGFPTLWTRFHYDAGTVDVRQALHRFDSYLERSAALPLCICLLFESHCSSNPGNAQLVEKALHHAHRWQRFTMYSNDVTVMHPLHLLQDLSVPMLEYLTLVPGVYATGDVQDRYSTITSTNPGVLKGGAPKLTYLMLGALAVYWLPPLSNITILRIEQRQKPTFPMFKLTPFLELLSLPSLNRLSLCGNIIEPFQATRTIYMPNLKSFRVAELDAIWALLAGIDAPQLNTLIIHMWPFHPRVNIIPFLDKAYSFPALNTLYLLGLHFGPHVIPLLTHMTSQATHVILSDKNIRTILGCSAGGVAWPRLRTLTCNIETVATIDDCVTFVKNRPKDSITVRILPSHMKAFDAELEALRMVSSVVSEFWQVDEPFWPHDVDSRFGPNCSYAAACFRTEEIY